MNSQPMTETIAQRVARLAAIHAAETTLKLRLIGSAVPVTIDKNTSRTDLIASETVATSYTPGGYTLTYTTGGITASDVAYNYSGAVGFVVAPGDTSDTIIGAWIDDGTDALNRVEFDTPVPVDQAGKQILAVVYDGYPPGIVGIEVVQP